MSLDGAAARTYGALTCLYPRRFRDEYGTDLVSLFRDQCRDESTGRVFVRAVVDLAITIPTQHLEARMHRNPSPLVPLIFLAVALAGVMLVILGGTEPTTMVAGLIVAVVAGGLAAASWRRAAPFRESTVSGSWWKFLVGGPSLLALVLLAAAAGVEAWLLGMTAVLASFALFAIGLALGVAHLLSRRTRGIPT